MKISILRSARQNCSSLYLPVYDRAMDIDTLTDHFGISKNTLQQIMKRQTNSTFFYYIEKKRMKIAKDFLLYTSTPISE